MSVLRPQLRKLLDQERTRLTVIDDTNITDSAYNLSVHENVVYAEADSDSGSFTIYLPDVSEAAGVVFSIYASIADEEAITLADNDESFDWDGDYTLDTDGDAICLYSDGRTWWVLENRIA